MCCRSRSSSDSAGSARATERLGERSRFEPMGIALPFVSYGGTALLTLFIGIGVLMSVNRHRKLVQT